MRNSSAIAVTPVVPSLRSALLALRVAPTQEQFMGPVADLLADTEQCPGCLGMVVMLGEEVIGYYRIEPSARSTVGADMDQPTRGLRCFFIDARWQKRGLGARALEALLTDLIARDPLVRAVVLAVDEHNHGAVALYRRAGFVDIDTRYHTSHATTQRLLWRTLT